MLNRKHLYVNIILLLFLCSFLVACAGRSTSTKGGEVAPLPPEITATPRMGGLPRICTNQQPVQGAPAEIGDAIGASDVWASGFSGPRATLLVGEHASTYTHYGWTTRLNWLIKASNKKPITITGKLVSRKYHYVLTFQSSGGGTPTSTLVIKPVQQQPASFVGSHWRMFGTYMYVPVSGCFRLNASWAGGGWTTYFAVARL